MFAATLIFITVITIPEREAASGKSTVILINYAPLTANRNRPHPNCLLLLPQNESSCKTIDMEMLPFIG